MASSLSDKSVQLDTNGNVTVSDANGARVPLHSLLSASIAPDGYSATATVLTDRAVSSVTFFDITAFLRSNGIVSGLVNERIEELIQALASGAKGTVITVAQGKPLEEGKDGEEEYRFRTKLMAGKLSESGRIDFRERGAINDVRAGQVLAVIKTHVPGKPGMRVDGEVDNPRPVKKVKTPHNGANVSLFSNDNVLTYTSLIAGHVRLVFNEIQVNPDYIIKGNLDYTKGNIEFAGNVEVSGNVENGFCIRAGGDVFVGGSIEPDAEVVAGKDITVRKTIQCGKKQCRVSAGGNLSAFRIVNSYVRAGGNVTVTDEVNDSIICCDGKFATNRATIIGADIEAVGGMVVRKIGLENNRADNRLTVGLTVKDAEQLETVEKELERIRHEKALIAKGIDGGDGVAYHNDHFENLEMKEQERIKRTNVARNKHAKVLNEKEESLTKDRNSLRVRVKNNPIAVLEAKGTIYPSCVIQLGKKVINVFDERKAPGIIEGVEL